MYKQPRNRLRRDGVTTPPSTSYVDYQHFKPLERMSERHPLLLQIYKIIINKQTFFHNKISQHRFWVNKGQNNGNNDHKAERRKVRTKEQDDLKRGVYKDKILRFQFFCLSLRGYSHITTTKE